MQSVWRLACITSHEARNTSTSASGCYLHLPLYTVVYILTPRQTNPIWDLSLLRAASLTCVERRLNPLRRVTIYELASVVSEAQLGGEAHAESHSKDSITYMFHLLLRYIIMFQL
jgi:hypothetical protein